MGVRRVLAAAGVRVMREEAGRGGGAHEMATRVLSAQQGGGGAQVPPDLVHSVLASVQGRKLLPSLPQGTKESLRSNSAFGPGLLCDLSPGTACKLTRRRGPSRLSPTLLQVYRNTEMDTPMVCAVCVCVCVHAALSVQAQLPGPPVCVTNPYRSMLQVQCDDCLRWVHIACEDIDEPTYEAMSNSEAPWTCSVCQGKRPDRSRE